jgi:hypothetical protein
VYIIFPVLFQLPSLIFVALLYYGHARMVLVISEVSLLSLFICEDVWRTIPDVEQYGRKKKAPTKGP